MTKIIIMIDEVTLRRIVFDHLSCMLGEDMELKEDNIKIEVKSKQNYKSEWEIAEFRAVYDSSTQG